MDQPDGAHVLARTDEPHSPSARTFADPNVTATGAPRAFVPFEHLDTLWFNTGTLCNITCLHCYIESSPTNDRLAYLSCETVRRFLDEAVALGSAPREVGFTGGEPFMNPEFVSMIDHVLARELYVLVLTNAMQPLMRPTVRRRMEALRNRLNATNANLLQIRVSLDHYTAASHDQERGAGSWLRAVAGIDWLVANRFFVTLAGRSRWGESSESLRAGYAALARDRAWPIDASDPILLTLFPEMDATADVPEITTECWKILGTSPSAQMCATQRMVVHRKNTAQPEVVPCTLLPYDTRFSMGNTLAESFHRTGGMFRNGAVKLCHPYCAQFCVLGGASCSAGVES